MSVINDLATPQATLLVLANAYGIHLVQGGLVLHEVDTTTSTTDKLVTVLQALANGPWEGPQEITYRGHRIDAVDFHFHPGTLSLGTDDLLQGIDSYFPAGITYNGTAYTAARLPRGVADEDNPSELQGIYRCQKIADYDASGNQIDDGGNIIATPTAPTVAVNATAGNITGRVTYKITFVGARGESAGGTTSAAVSPAGQQVNLTNIPLGPAGTTKRHIYRSTPSGEQTHKLVAILNDNTTTSYTDNAAALLAAIVPVVHDGYLYYSANPARVVADLIIVQRGLPKERIHWASWRAWRDYCEQMIPWAGGFTASAPSVLTWRATGNMSPGASGSLTKSGGTEGVWDAGTTSENTIPANSNGGLHWVAGAGRYMLGLSRTSTLTTPTYTGILIALYMETGSVLKVYSDGRYLGSPAFWTPGDTFDVKVEGGVFTLYQNSVQIDTSAMAMPAVPPTELYGAAAAYGLGSQVASATFSPLAGQTTGDTRYIPRFEAHIAFTEPTSLEGALDQVCFMCASDWQEDGSLIRFLTPEPCAPKNTVPLHAAQRQIVHHFDADDEDVDNIVKRTITAYHVPARDLYNHFLGTFRNVDDKDLKEDFVEVEDTDLQDVYGRRDPGPISLGSMNRSQAKRVLEWVKRIRATHSLFCELDGQGDSMHVLPGDIVEVTYTNSTYQWNAKLFMVIEVTDEPDGADTRSFLLQEYDPEDYYKDLDHDEQQRVVLPTVPSPFAKPPQVVSVTLSERNDLQQDQTVISMLRGNVQFANFTETQKGRVWLKRPGDADYFPTNKVLDPHPDTLLAAFEFSGVQPGQHFVKVVPETQYETADYAGAVGYTWTITGKTIAPGIVTNMRYSFDRIKTVALEWDAPADGDVKEYELYKINGALEEFITTLPGRIYYFDQPAAAVTYKVYARNWSGVRSSVLLSPQLTYTPAYPPTVTVTQNPVSWDTNPNGVRVGRIRLGFNFGLYQGAYTSQSAHVFITRPNHAEVLHDVIQPILGSPATGITDIPVYVIGNHTIRIQTFDVGARTSGSSVSFTVNVTDAGYNDVPWQTALQPSNFLLSWNGGKIKASWTKALAVNARYQLSRTNLFAPSDIIREGTETTVEFDALVTGSQTYYLRGIDDQSHTSGTLSNAVTVTAPAQPGAVSTGEDGVDAIFTIPLVAGATQFLVDDDNSSTVWLLTANSGGTTEFRFPMTSGKTAYNVTVYALNAGSFASPGRAASYSVAAPATPTAPSIALDQSTITHTFAPDARYSYEFGRGLAPGGVPADGTVVHKTRGGTWDDTTFPTSSRTVQYWLRAVHVTGKQSLAVAYSQTFSAPALPSLLKDANTRPNFITLHVSTATARARIKNTVYQIRTLPSGSFPASINEGTDRQKREVGAPADVIVNWAPGGQVEIRVAHEDAFTLAQNAGAGDHLWSTVSHAFDQWGGADFGRIGDTSFDISSALARMLIARSQIPITGGGDVRWSAGYITGEQVTWQNVTGATDNGDGTVTKTAAGGAWGTAGAAGTQALAAGKCAVQYEVRDDLKTWAAGFTNGTSATISNIVAGFLISNSDQVAGRERSLFTLESGALTLIDFGNNSVKNGDILRIERDASGNFTFYKNAVLIATRNLGNTNTLRGGVVAYTTGTVMPSLRVEGTIGTANLLTWSQRFTAQPVDRSIAGEGYIDLAAGNATLAAGQGLIARLLMPSAAAVTWGALSNTETFGTGSIRKSLAAAAAWNGSGFGGAALTGAARLDFQFNPRVAAGVTGYAAACGLNAANVSSSYTDIDFAIMYGTDVGINGVTVYENGSASAAYFAGESSTTIAASIFSIEVYYDTTAAANRVRFKRDGVTFHTSTTAPAASLTPDCSLHYPGNEMLNVKFVQSAGAASAATPVVVDYRNYSPPSPQSGYFDLTVAVNNPDNGKCYLFDGRILEPGQIIRAGAFFPQASIQAAFIQAAAIISAHIGTAQIKDLHVDSIRVNKIVAQAIDAYIIFVDKIGSRNYVTHGSQTAQKETITNWENLVGVSASSDGTLRRTAAFTGAYDAGASSDRAIHHGNGYIEQTAGASASTANSRAFGLSYARSTAIVANIDYAISWGTDGNMYTSLAGASFVSAGAFTATTIGKVAIEGANIVFYKDGVAVRTVAWTANYPMVGDLALYHLNAVNPVTTLYGVLCNSTGTKVQWKNLVNITFDANDDITGAGFGATWGGSGCSSVGGKFGLDAGQDGSVSTVHDGNATKSKTFGLSTSDTSQTDLSITFGCVISGNNFYAIGSGIYLPAGTPISLGTVTLNDVLAVCREGGVMKIRKNGVLIYTWATTSSAALIVDTAFYDTAGSMLKTVRLHRAGAIGQGWQLPNDGPGEFNNGFKILDVLVDDLRARSVNLFNDNGVFISTDNSFVLPHKITAITLDNYGFPDDGLDECTYQLSVAWPMDKDDYANVKSVRQCQVRVLNHFHEEVRAAQKFTFVGDGVCAQSRYKWKYAHPAVEAVFALSFYNGFGWSQEVFMRAGVIYQTLSGVPKNRRTTSPQELHAGRAAMGAAFGWRLAADSPGAQSFHFRKVGQTAWQDSNVNISSTVNETALPNTTNFTTGTPKSWAESLLSDTWYEARVRNTSTGEYSNIVRFKTYPPRNATEYATAETPYTVYATIASGTSITIKIKCDDFNFLDPDVLYLYRLKHSDGTLTQLTVGTGTIPPPDYTYTDTVTAGETYTYWAVYANNTTANKSMGSEPVTVTMPQSSNKDPYGFFYSGSSSNGTLTFKWTLGSSTGNVTFQWAYYNAAFQANPVWTDISLGSTTATQHSFTPAGNAAGDPIVARVKVADAGTLPSNSAVSSYAPPPPRDY
jgi:hypothetical protein